MSVNFVFITKGNASEEEHEMMNGNSKNLNGKANELVSFCQVKIFSSCKYSVLHPYHRHPYHRHITIKLKTTFLLEW